jgi:cbb3-type cytochrome oxidase subunit 3
MLGNLKALIVVLGLATIVFVIAKPVCLRFMAHDDFVRRRNVWCALTITAFASPSFWIYAFVALGLIYWAARKDPNPTALYLLLLHVIPPLGFYIPVVGINQLFELSNYRILSFALLLPTALEILRTPRRDGRTGMTQMDILLLAYLALQLVLFIPYESVTNTMRRAFLSLIDVLLLYYVVSRDCVTRDKLSDAMITFCLSSAILATIAVFETVRHWLLYQSLGSIWGDAIRWAYLLRGESLRAQASAGHSIPLGYMLALAFGFWLFIRTQVRTKVSPLVLVWLWVGMVASYARSPWVVGVIIFFAHAAMGPHAVSRFAKATLVALVLSAAAILSPMGDKIIDSLPFIGTLDASTIDYREELARMSWALIQQNPWLGNPFVMNDMESLRQGQGIIDLVNAYASVALFYGVIGLALFAGFFLRGMWLVFRAERRQAFEDPDMALLGVTLLACMIGTMAMLAAGGFNRAHAQMFWILGGLAAGYACAARGQMEAARTGGFAATLRPASG